MNTAQATSHMTHHSGLPPAPDDPNTSDFKRLLNQDAHRLRLEPKDQDDVAKIAARAAKQRFCGVENEDDAFLRIMIGTAIGLPAMASVQGIRLIETKDNNGKISVTPCMYTKLKVALLMSRTDIIEYIRPDPENDDKTATWRAKRRGQDEQHYTFTMDDAVTAGLVDRGATDEKKKSNNYNKHPRPMLSWRAAGRLCDLVGGDILNGIASTEDLQEDAEREAIGTGPIPANTPPPVPARDWAGELEKVKAAIRDPGFDREARRKMIGAFQAEAPSEYAEDLKSFYNAAKAAKANGGAPVQAPQTAPADTGTVQS